MLATNYNYPYAYVAGTRAGAEAAYGDFLVMWREVSLGIRSELEQVGPPVNWGILNGTNCPPGTEGPRENKDGDYLITGVKEDFRMHPDPVNMPDFYIYLRLEYNVARVRSINSSGQEITMISPSIRIKPGFSAADLEGSRDLWIRSAAPGVYYGAAQKNASTISLVVSNGIFMLGNTEGQFNCGLFVSYVGNPLTGAGLPSLIMGSHQLSYEYQSGFFMDSPYSGSPKILGESYNSGSRTRMLTPKGVTSSLVGAAVTWGSSFDATHLSKTRYDPDGQEIIIPGPYWSDYQGGTLYSNTFPGTPFMNMPSGAGGPGAKLLIGTETYACVSLPTLYGDTGNYSSQNATPAAQLRTWVKV